MRILMINYEFPPVGGGTGNACYYTLKEFINYPHLDIHLVTFSPDNRTRVERFSSTVTIHYVRCGRKQSLHYWKTSELVKWLICTWLFLRTHLVTNRYDVIHCWSGWPAGILGYYFKSAAPYIVSLRGSDIPGYSKRTRLLDAVLLKRLSRRVWKCASFVTIVSQDAAKLARKTYDPGFNIIHNGVDNIKFQPSRVSAQSNSLKLLFVGRLIPRKGIQELLDAIRILKNNLDLDFAHKLKLTVIGTGTLDEEIKEFSHHFKLNETVEFLGAVQHDELPEHYRNHDVFVIPSHAEAFSNSMQEAIASGLAIISTETGSADLLSGNGLIVKKQDPQDIAKVIMFLAGNPKEVLKMKNRSRELSSDMGWDASCKAYEKLYDKSTKQGENRQGD